MKPINFKRTLLGMLFLLALSLVNKSFSQFSDNIYASVENRSADLGKHKNKEGQDIVYQSEKMGALANQNKRDKTSEQDAHFRNRTNWFENPTANRYMFTPTGYSIGKDKGYYQNYMVLGNFAGYGLTDNLTLGIGVTPILVYLLDVEIVVSANAKFTIPIVDNKWNAGAGLLYSNIEGDPQVIGYSIVTYGSRDNNISVGAGFAWEQYRNTKPVFTLSGMLRLSENFALVGESWLLLSKHYSSTYEVDYLYGISLRCMVNWGSIDVGMSNVYTETPIPTFSLMIPFGK